MTEKNYRCEVDGDRVVFRENEGDTEAFSVGIDEFTPSIYPNEKIQKDDEDNQNYIRRTDWGSYFRESDPPQHPNCGSSYGIDVAKNTLNTDSAFSGDISQYVTSEGEHSAVQTGNVKILKGNSKYMRMEVELLFNELPENEFKLIHMIQDGSRYVVGEDAELLNWESETKVHNESQQTRSSVTATFRKEIKGEEIYDYSCESCGTYFNDGLEGDNGENFCSIECLREVY